MLSQSFILPKDVVNYLGRCKLTENDPAIVLDWNTEHVEYFVAAANALEYPAQPQWISTIPGAMTPFSLQSDIVTRLATVSGGRFGNIALAPNTLSQYGNIIKIMQQIEVDPYVVNVMTKGLPPNSPLATSYYVTSRKVSSSLTPCILVPPQTPSHQVFA